jgi:glucosylceramidase
MKTNQEMNHGGKLLEEYYQTWADYFVKFINAYQAAGIDISYITIQNEPEATQAWDSCLYTAKEEGEFVREYLGPTLEKAGLSHIRIFIWDHNKESVYDRAKITLEDENTKKYVSGIAVHWYTGDHFESIDLVKKVYPELDIFFTEGCVEYTRFADSGEVQKAEMYAHDMIGNFNAGLNGFIDWNLLLDEKGGPNHVGNYCAAPMMCEGATDSLEKRLSYYYIGQFSRYIKPGAKKIYVTRYTDKVETVGFLNPDGEKVIVLLNKTMEDVEVTLRDQGKGNYVKIAAHSIMTIRYN